MREWVRYWRADDRPLEAMHAHFERHTYHRHSHEGYSFGVTDAGVQAFTCRGGSHTSAAGMVMAFNPDDPHDGGPVDESGFTYRIVHIGAGLVADVLRDVAGRPAGLPLFADPVVHDPVLAAALRRLHASLGGAPPAPGGPVPDEGVRYGAVRHGLVQDELLVAVVTAMVRRGATRPVAVAAPVGERVIAQRVRALLEEGFAGHVTAGDVAAAAGTSRFAAYRSFRRVHGMAPSDYQRQLRLRAARRLLVRGHRIADVASAVGFADQSHLTRWFVRYYGITPGAFR
ncbi:AraC family transcriptional regulator [Actinomadura scrupuli]|uniref:AraC family transcriptional regulator n=1 Tax=Actinomadura scrupuli TaxID=559629 RepID=UPI003D968216